MLRKTAFNKISRFDLELSRSGGAIVGNFHIGIEDASASRIRIGIALIALLVTLPAVLGLAAGVVKQFFGIASFYDSMATWNLTLMKGSLFVGAPVALIACVVAVTRVGFTRAQDRIKTFLTVQINPLGLFALGIAMIVVALFYGHLVADAWACMRGIASAC